MASIPLHYVDLRTFCYVTEDEKRVEEALATLLPEEFDIQRTESEGHHGDRIVVLTARIENADEIRTALDSLADLPDEAFEHVVDQLDERVNDNCAFFLTLDKQAAFNGEIRRGDGITVRAKVEAYPAEKEAAVENIEGLLEEL